MIYILNSHGHPLMPTENHAKIRVLLKQGMAKILYQILIMKGYGLELSKIKTLVK